MTDNDFIKIAIDISKKEQYPYGAIVVKGDRIIGRSDNKSKVSETQFGHAEITVIEQAMGELGGYLCAEGGKGCVIYSSCEPCAMCMGAILYTGIEKLVYAATLEDSLECVNEILTSCKKIAKICKNRKVEIVSELNREQAVEVMKEWKNKNL